LTTLSIGEGKIVRRDKTNFLKHKSKYCFHVFISF
jgi:hypothetical protein